MKIAIISDTHFGYKNDSQFFLDESLNYFNDIFFPYLKQNNITQVIHLGDLMDRRKYVNFHTLHQVQEKFIKYFEENNINLHIILGNHDTYYKNTNQINSIKELFSRYNSVQLYENPIELNFDGLKIGLVPWITNDNETICMDFIQSTSASILGGHFEINGFEVVQNIRHSSGTESSVFSKFDKVLSGHFHIRQSKGNIHYLGTQYQLNFGDINSKKGFSVLDTITRELQHVENIRTAFNVIRYDDLNGMEKVDPEKIKNTHVKLLVLNKTKHKMFDKFVELLNTCELQEFSIIEEFDTSINSDDDVDITQDTISIIANEIDVNENLSNKEKLKMIVKELYMESMTL